MGLSWGSLLLLLSWVRLGVSWGPPGVSWASPGGLLGLSWGSLGLSWGSPGTPLGVSWGSLGGLLGHPGGLLGRSWGPSGIMSSCGASWPPSCAKPCRSGLPFWLHFGPIFGSFLDQTHPQGPFLLLFAMVFACRPFCSFRASWRRLGALLAPTWPLQGDFWTPKWSQNGPKIHQNGIQNWTSKKTPKP